MEKTQIYKRTMAGTVGAGVGTLINASNRTFYILEFKTTTLYHKAGDSEKIIVDQIELGRDSKCQVHFDDACETVSRKHAAIVREGDGWKLIPLSKTNATFVNGQPITGEQILNSGDEIRLSIKGPVIGFIAPQGTKGLVKSIAMTERLKLFQKQALRPYKTGIAILSVILVFAIAGLSAYIYMQGEELGQLENELKAQTEKINKQANLLNIQAAKVKETENKGRELLEEINQTRKSALQAQAQLDSLRKLSGVTENQLKEAQDNAIKAQELLKEVSEKARSEAATADSVKKSFENTQAQMQHEVQAIKEKYEAYVTDIQNQLNEAKGDREVLQNQLEEAVKAIEQLDKNSGIEFEIENDTNAVIADPIEDASIKDYLESLDEVIKELDKETQLIDAI